jgi:hypothetical protein
VGIIVQWKDIPSNGECLTLQKQELERLGPELERTQAEFQAYRLHQFDELRLRIERDISHDENNAQITTAILEFDDIVSQVYRQREDDLKRCESILMKLPDWGEENVVQFRRLSAELKRLPASTDDRHDWESEINWFIDSVWDRVRVGCYRLIAYDVITPEKAQPILSLDERHCTPESPSN